MKPNPESEEIKLPKRKVEPSLAKSNMATKNDEIKSNAFLATGTFNTNKAKINCKPQPIITSLQAIFLLLLLNKKARKTKTNRPNNPLNISTILNKVTIETYISSLNAKKKVKAERIISYLAY